MKSLSNLTIDDKILRTIRRLKTSTRPPDVRVSYGSRVGVDGERGGWSYFTIKFFWRDLAECVRRATPHALWGDGKRFANFFVGLC